MPGRAPACAPVRRPPDHRALDDRGAVTVEAALGLCTLAVFLVLAMAALGAVITTVRCTDAARELARLAARGEPDRGLEIAALLAPTGTRLTLTRQGDLVTAEATTILFPPLPIPVSSRAVAALEPGLAGPTVGTPP